LILDTNALSAYLDRTPEAVEIVSEAREIAIPVIVAGEFAFGIARRGAFFIGRQHKINLPVTCLSKLVQCGKTGTGTIYEQTVEATDPETGATLLLRRIEIRLFEKTRDGERVIGLLTNLPATVSATAIAEIYTLRVLD